MPRARIWLISPYFDLLFVCGIAPWIMGFFAMGCLSDPMPSSAELAHRQYLTIFLAAASLMIGETHQFTSIIRLCKRIKPWFKASYYYLACIFLLPVAMVVLILLEALLGPLIPDRGSNLPDVATFSHSFFMSFFPVVLIHHFCIQAKAIVLMYCGKAGYRLGRVSNAYLTLSMWSLVITGALTIAAPLSLSHLTVDATPFWVMSVGTLFVLVLSIIHEAADGAGYPPPAAALTWLNLAAFVLWPNIAVWLFVPIFYHATQHWAVALSVAKREQKEDDWARDSISLFLKTALPIVVVTCLVVFFPLAIDTPLNTIRGAVPGLPPLAPNQVSLPVALSMTVFYIHYIADRFVWRPAKKEAA